MKNIYRAVFFLTALTFSLMTGVSAVFADGTPYGAPAPCTPVYGGGVQCPRVGQVLINKTVQNPSTGVFVDNLGPVDPKFRTQQVVTFHVAVQNSGDQMINSITVKDTMPQFVDFMSGPGSYDSNSRVLTWTVNNLAGGATQTFEIQARTVHPAVLPQDKNVVCPVNAVDAVSDSQTDHDESQFCIQKEANVPAVPKAGPEMTSLLGLAGALMSGILLRKKSSAK